MPIDDSIFWSDSTSVLRYIENQDKRFNTFVANRIGTIRDNSSPSQWRHVDGKLNPADDASRGLSADDFLSCARWIKGPEFLWRPSEVWPKRPDGLGEVLSNDPEVKKEVITCISVKDEGVRIVDSIIEHFSSWARLKKFFAWMLRFRQNLLVAYRKRSNGNSANDHRQSTIKPITVTELKIAERELLKHVQETNFPEELASCRGAIVPASKSTRGARVKKTSSIFTLDPVLIDGLLRVGGRLRRASIPEDAKHQVIIPKAHHVTDLIVRHYHEVSGHSGREYVLSLLRGSFWIIHANTAVRRILSRCVDCRRRQGSPGEQKMADLPVDRVTADQPPFTNVGVDFFGPFFVKRGRAEVKRYGCIFTCLSTRAVHIEVAHSLDTSSFVYALRRFIARRGNPNQMRSDNGTNIVSGGKEIRQAIKEWNQQQINEFLLQRYIQWLFNPPGGSHHGGIWERCIRSVRKVLAALLHEQRLDDESLPTFLCEVEAILNGRPLTSVSNDPRDLEALTPNHLLLLRAGPDLPPGMFTKEDCYSRRRWRHVQYLSDQFWRRWTREYLPLLQSRQKWNRSRRNFREGDIVLIVNKTTPRSFWPLARITEVYPDAKGQVRKVKLRTKLTILERPITKCILLEGVDEF